MELFPTATNKAPDGITCTQVLSGGNVKLRAAYAIPPQPKGTVLILGGRAEFIERYFETMRDIMAMGYAVATFDWRGQGGSQRLLADRKRGHIDSFASYDADLDAIYSRILVAQCPKPFYGLAHSTGGHLLLRALRGKKWLERAVITAPLMGFHFGAWPEAVARGLAFIATKSGLSATYLPGYSNLPFKRGDFGRNPLTSEIKRFDRDMLTLDEHPELAVGGPTYGWLRAALLSIDELQRWPEDRGPSCPTLIAMAGLDKVVNNVGTKAFLAQAPGFSSITIADSKHEILNEKDEIRQRFLAAFQAFIAD
jgi:lysophospholipase